MPRSPRASAFSICSSRPLISSSSGDAHGSWPDALGETSLRRARRRHRPARLRSETVRDRAAHQVLDLIDELARRPAALASNQYFRGLRLQAVDGRAVDAALAQAIEFFESIFRSCSTALKLSSFHRERAVNFAACDVAVILLFRYRAVDPARKAGDGALQRVDRRRGVRSPAAQLTRGATDRRLAWAPARRRACIVGQGPDLPLDAGELQIGARARNRSAGRSRQAAIEVAAVGAVVERGLSHGDFGDRRIARRLTAPCAVRRQSARFPARCAGPSFRPGGQARKADVRPARARCVAGDERFSRCRAGRLPSIGKASLRPRGFRFSASIGR